MLVVGLVAGGGLGLVLAPQRDVGGAQLSRYRFVPLSLDAPTERYPAWSPDGMTIAYTATLNGVAQVMTKALGASDAAQLTHLTENAQRPFWSPDGATVYFTAGGDDPDQSVSLWSISAAGGAPERVIEGATSAAIAPDGKTMAFVKGRRLWLGQDPRAGGAPPREFGKPPLEEPDSVDAFSPDGSKLAVSKDGDVWIVSYPTGEARRLEADVLSGAGATSWMPDSRRLVLAEALADKMALSIIDTVSGVRHVIYAGPLTWGLVNPSVSPDGRRIALVGAAVRWDLAEVAVANGAMRPVLGGAGISWWPAWAPSGNQYAFAAQGSKKPEVRVVSSLEGAAGAVRTLVQVDARATGAVRWAPDGNRLTFRAFQASGPVLMIANASSGRVLPVEDGADQTDNGVWSPDGQWLAYTRRVGSDMQLVKKRPGSSAAPQVLRSWAADEAAGAARIPVDWSPDGAWLLAQRQSRPGIFLVSADGQTERELSSQSGGQRRPRLVFSHDGRSVLLLARNRGGTGGPWQLRSIDVATGAERVVTDVSLPTTTGDVAGFSLHPDGTRFLTSIASWPFDIWMVEGFDE